MLVLSTFLFFTSELSTVIDISFASNLSSLVWNMCVCVRVLVCTRVSARAPVWQCPGTLAGAGAAQSVQESRVLASSVSVLDRRTTLPPTFGCQRI